MKWLTLLLLGLSACVVSTDEMDKQGVMGAVWDASDRDLEQEPLSAGDSEMVLFEAIESGDLGSFLDALDEKPQLALKHDGYTALSKTIVTNNLEMLTLLVEHDAPISPEDFCLAIEQGCESCLDELFSGALPDLNALAMKGMTPLIYAVRWGNPRIVHKMLEAGADPLLADTQGTLPKRYVTKKENLGQFENHRDNYQKIRELLNQAEEADED